MSISETLAQAAIEKKEDIEETKKLLSDMREQARHYHS